LNPFCDADKKVESDVMSYLGVVFIFLFQNSMYLVHLFEHVVVLYFGLWHGHVFCYGLYYIWYYLYWRDMYLFLLLVLISILWDIHILSSCMVVVCGMGLSSYHHTGIQNFRTFITIVQGAQFYHCKKWLCGSWSTRRD